MRHLIISWVLLTASLLTSTAVHAIEAGFVYPVMSPRMSSDYGKRLHPINKVYRHHHGIDLAAPKYSPIRAIQGGLVVFAGDYAGYGKMIVIMHENGITSHYGHCQEINADVGQKVKSGEIIALVGSTGISTGPHLHFEIRKDGKTIDPERLIPGLAETAEG